MNTAFPSGLVPPAVSFRGVTGPERRAAAVAHGAALAAANPAHAEAITQKVLRTIDSARIAPRPPGPDMRSRLPRGSRAGTTF